MTQPRSSLIRRTGRHNCVGRNLGLMNLRFVTAFLVQNYDFNFPVGDDGSQVMNDMTDCFTAVPGKLNLIFKPRARNQTLA